MEAYPGAILISSMRGYIDVFFSSSLTEDVAPVCQEHLFFKNISWSDIFSLLIVPQKWQEGAGT